MRQLIAGNWKMHMLRAPAAELAKGVRDGAQGLACDLLVCPPFTAIETGGPRTGGSERGGRRPGLPPPGTGRAYRRRVGRHAARCRCDLGDPWPLRAPAEPWRDRRTGAREGAGGGRGRPDARSSASARPRTSGRRARRPRWSAGSSPAACPSRSPAWWPMSRSGRSAPAGPPPSRTSPRCTPSSARNWCASSAMPGRGSASCTAARCGRRMPASLLAVPHVGGGLIGGASLKAEDFLAIARAAQGS